MKRLFIVRHAKSSWDNPGLTDFDRPLNNRGKNDAPLMGEVLNNQSIRPDLIISSPANRAQTTAKIIADKVGYTNNIQLEKRVYEASAEMLLSIINTIGDEFKTAFIFGHNPGFTYLAESLSGEYFGNVPTCGIVGLEFDLESWEMISTDTATVFCYDYPKRHK